MAPEAELIKDVLRHEHGTAHLDGTKDLVPSCVNPFPQTFFVLVEHNLENLDRTLSVLIDLDTGGGIEDGETGVDVPSV